MADYASSSHPDPDLNNVPYSILAEAYDSPATPPRERPLKVLTAVVASVVFLVSLVGLVVNLVPEKTAPHSRVRDERGVLPRGVAEGVSAKSYPTPISSDGVSSYNWTNAMLSWQRTAYHFQPEKNWMNDPNGPLYHMGWYHLFYQYNPDSATWGNITWGHAVSVDLIHWLYLPLAMVPDQHYDRKGVWTGSATILPGGEIKILYTGDDDNSIQVQNLAYPSNHSDPLLLNWTKYEANPVMVPPEGIGLSDFRDPTTAWVGPDGEWRVIVGSKINTTGIALVYHTTNFTSYELVDHVLHSVAMTGMWECIDFYPVSTNSSFGLETSMVGPDVKHVLKASIDDLTKDYYAIGTYDPVNDTWTPDDASMDVGIGLKYDYGWLYASKSFYDPVEKRRILWGWINETDTEDDDFAKGWASVQAVPREILYDDKTGTNILQQPVKEIESLRLNSTEFEDILIEAGSIVPLDIGMATQLDMFAEFEIQGIDSFKATAATESNITECIYAETRTSYGPFGLAVLADGSLSELTPIYFRVVENDDGRLKTYFCADESRSSLAPEVLHTVYGSEIPVLDGEKYTVRILVDHSIIESFAQGGRRVITSRVYPTQAIYGAARLFLFNNATGINVTASIKVWELNSAFIRPFPLDQVEH
ncbi:hypothetical protein MLD38_002842 [Melastoma candidum]|uniref:Uncharacterized protein n=1 Tax=Melastoma candidum TaxID=119954 RepID=A0ACB9S970_9MYRT|nr:hypothetical protein MLD38_002842 [Melastoma candidum]